MKRLDPFLISLIASIILASVLPCPAIWQPELEKLTSFLIMLIFFFQGIKLHPRALLEGISNWRLQCNTLLVSFVIFPLVGIGLFKVFHLLFPTGFLLDELWLGVLFLCCIPSTIQSSITLTSIAKGNVSGSICAATLSNILGIFLTPLICSFVFHHKTNSGININAIFNIIEQLLLPFILGQCARPWLEKLINRYQRFVALTDRASIIVLVYAAFSASVIEGIWQRVPALVFLKLFGVDVSLLLLILGVAFILGRLSKQNQQDTITLQFCGSKKALTTGVTMASIIFPDNVGIVILPLMIFHQIQLFICSILARYYSSST